MAALHLPPSLRRVAPAALPLLLLLMLAGLNALAVMGIVTARRTARLAALQDLRLETEEHARSVEAGLATLRRQLVQFSRKAELRGLLTAGEGSAGAVTAAREAASREVGPLKANAPTADIALASNCPRVLRSRPNQRSVTWSTSGTAR